jgi:hypothetical protein
MAYQPSKSELFSFGSVIYEFPTTWQPYEDKDDAEIEHLFSSGESPGNAVSVPHFPGVEGASNS